MGAFFLFFALIDNGKIADLHPSFSQSSQRY